MDVLTFISPANVRVLLVAVNELKQSDFENILVTLKRVKDVRAVDLIHNPGKFNPQAYPQGHIYFNFITRDDDVESFFLHDFEPFRKTAIVIGIAKWNSDLTDERVRELKAELKRQYPGPISHFIMLFDCPIDYDSKLSEVYTVDEKTTNMETKICDITSRFLSNFSTYASAYEHTTLRSPGNFKDSVSKLKKRMSTSFELNSEKIKQLTARGRKLKLSANFYLMAGNLKSALSDFCEAIFNLKTANDIFWLASALDGLAVCIFLLSSIGAPYQLPPFIDSLLEGAKDIETLLLTPTTSPRPSIQLNALSTQQQTSAASLNIPLVPLAVVEETIFNCGKLSSVFYEQAKILNVDYVPQIVVSECLLRYASISVLISTEGQLDMKLIHEILYSSFIPSVKSNTSGFELDHFNNLCSHILDTEFRTLSSGQQLKIYFTMISLYSKTNMQMKKCLMLKNFLDIIINSKNIIPVTKFEHNELNILLREYCETYGINVQKLNSSNSPNLLQKKILLQITAICLKIKFYEGYIHYASLLFKYYRQLLTAKEQFYIFEKMKEFMLLVDSTPEYWDSNILLDFSFDLESEEIVEGENFNATVVLRNPFAFEINVNDFELLTENNFSLKLVSIDGKNSLSNKPSIFIRPFSEIMIPLIIIPETHGKLIVSGINASVSSCKKQKFVVQNNPVNSFLPKLKTEEISVAEINDKIKVYEINVVYKQPLLKLVDVKLSDKWIMLLDGERKQFRVVLKNISNTEINHLISKFKDSTTDRLNAELSNKSLQPNEVYEIEYELLMRKPFKILNKNDLSKIKGNSLFHLDVEIWGKLGVNEANLVLEYSHQKSTFSKFKRLLNIPINLTVYPSVELAGCDMISLTSNTRISQNNTDPCWEYLEKMRAKNHKLSSFCLLALDFVNMWSEEMEVSISYTPGTLNENEIEDSNNSVGIILKEPFTTKSLLHSRKNIRMFIPLLRMDLDEEFLNRRIPSLRNKQFIIDKKTPLAEQKFIKHAFWYKEEILKRINATWKVPSTLSSSIHTGKSGIIDLRGFRFSSKMIEVLEVEKIGIKLKLLDENDVLVDLDNVRLNTFYTIRVQLTNRNNDEVFGMIRHIPVCKDPPYTLENKIIINGVLQTGTETPLKPGESRVYDLGVVFLEKGECEWGALFDEIEGWEEGNMNIKKQHLQREQIKLKIH